MAGLGQRLDEDGRPDVRPVDALEDESVRGLLAWSETQRGVSRGAGSRHGT